MEYHISVYVDTDGSKCVTASFVFGDDLVTREYEIHVIQYKSKDTLGGPPGCLQYFYAGSGTVRTFNFGDQSFDRTRKFKTYS